MRRYWKRTFEEIKESNPVVFPPTNDADGKIPTPLRFDGSRTWEEQLLQWSEDVSLYLSETESQLNELLQPKDPSRGGGNDPGGMLRSPSRSSDPERSLTREEIDAEGRPLPGRAPRTSSKRSVAPPPSPVGTLPIALTALDKSLPPIPRPRPVAPGDAVLPHTDVGDKSKNVWIVTTGALPWMTGTSVNPLLRAAYLSAGRREAGGSVTIVLPWVERTEDQKKIYGGEERRFEAPEDQEEYVRTWLRDTAKMREASEELRIEWYTAWQEVLENSLYSMGDLIGLIPEEKCDICVLEEPEHLNWYRAPGENWTSKFKHVIGIVHTNYFVYATEQPAAFIRAPGMRLLSSWMCRAHCHRLIKLSGTLQQFAPEKELVENVHGVRRTFLDVGEELRAKLTSPGGTADPVFGADATPTVYFIGKMLWSKGIGSLIDLVKYAEDSADLRVKIDMYGGGPNQDEASAKATGMGLDMPFHGPIDHAALGKTHKVFVNPSTSEVLCTTVAEALAMGKFVVLPSHPSNDFFSQFPNCLPYTNKEEFVGNLYYALTHAPEPLSEEYSYALSWEAATERFAAAGSVSVAEAEAMEEALSSTEAGIDIDLPPLTASVEQRKKLSRTFRRTRGRYRNFRSRLSQEITKSNVLPKELQHRLITELDKRLDVDLDELLSSPKLRVKLSPAKLDKLLLELYDSVVEGPRGDVFRVIGGGATVGRQNLYIKQQQKSKLTAESQHGEKLPGMVVDVKTENSSHDATGVVSTPTSLVKRALQRNLPPKGTANLMTPSAVSRDPHPKPSKERGAPKMSLLAKSARSDSTWSVRLVRHGSFAQLHRPPISKYSPLI